MKVLMLMRTRILFLAFAASLFTTMLCGARSTDDEGHTLIALWKEYHTAAGNDRPEDILSVLDRIKAEASVRKLAWDYYDACDRYRSVKVSQNWKLREEQDKLFEKEIEDFGVPVAVFYSKRLKKLSDARKFVEENADGLKAGYNPEFYSKDYRTGGRDCSKVLCRMIGNDYEYALWSIYFADKSTIRELGQKYATELRLLNGAEILQARYDEIHWDKGAEQEDCLKLREDCRRFISAAGKLSGEHRAFGLSLKTPQFIIDNLEEPSLSCRIEDGTLIIQAGNLPGANVRMKDKDGKTIFSTYIENTVRSFFVPDTLKTQLPLIDDGTYSLKCTSGKTAYEFEYRRHSLSASLRRASGHFSIFVADQKSGKPLESCTISLKTNGRTVSERLELRDGFTPLPENIEKTILAQEEKDECILKVSGRSESGELIETEEIRLYKGYVAEENEELKTALLFDRKAFNPGDTVHFKAILYSGYHKHTLCKAGIEVTARLYDPGSSLIAEHKLVTNEFGSVAGDFTLPRSGRGGTYRIVIVADKRNVGSDHFTVDEFVLPTFVLEWDKMDDPHMPLDSLVVTGTLKSLSGHGMNSAKCGYSILYNNNESEKGELQVDASGRFSITLVPEGGDPDISHIFYINIHITDGTGETSEFSKKIFIFPKPEEKSPNFIFEDIEGQDIAVRLTAGDRTTWVAVDLFGIGDILLESRLVRIEPAGGLASEVISFPYKEEYPNLVSLHLVYFQNGREYSHTLNSRRPVPEYRIPIDFTRFTDRALPGTAYGLSFKTAPFAECAASIFDVSTETVRENRWPRIKPVPIHYHGPFYSTECGGERSYRTDIYNRGRMMKAQAAYSVAESNDILASEEEAIPVMLDNDVPVSVRSDFANTLCWEPFVRSDAQGNASVKFTTSDKLSTYFVQLFVHDKDFNNSVIRKEMLVSIPVKVAIMEPQFLYENDRYTARITLSNSLRDDISGKVSIRFFDGEDYRNAGLISGEGKEVTIPAHGSAGYDFSIVCPEDISTLGVLASFDSEGGGYGSDAVFVRIPVRKACQTITEAHSAVLFEGADKEALVDRLRGQFTGISGQEAEVREISILRMLTDAVPDRIEPASDNAISLSEALLSDHLLGKLGVGRMTEKQRDDIRRKLGECINSDGGYAWFKGMKSSQFVTAHILIQAKEYGLPVSAAAVRYLDNGYFNRKDKLYGPLFLSLGQYAYVRSLYGDVPFDAKTVPSKEMKKFRKAIKQYLLPSGTRGLEGNILSKARRILTLKALQSNPELATAWGIKAGKKMEKSIVAYTESILQYAQKHVDGGWYYPNAVMPWRGLLESELDAHVLLCKLLEGAEGLTEEGIKDARQKADGIRLWMMLQKETQEWDSDPSYISALSEVLKGSESLLNTKVIALSATYTKPLSDIKESGNGFRAERRYLRNGKEIHEGDILHVGDRITAEYRIWSQENRSFVKLTAFRPASLRPVNQLSTCYGSLYTDVKADRTEYWYDVFPEENITVREDFFISQEGSFQSPAIIVESIYAPHYRANDKYDKPLISVQ